MSEHPTRSRSGPIYLKDGKPPNNYKGPALDIPQPRSGALSQELPYIPLEAIEPFINLGVPMSVNDEIAGSLCPLSLPGTCSPQR